MTPERIDEITSALLTDAGNAARTLLYADLPEGGTERLIILDAVRLAFCQTIESAIAIFNRGDHSSSGALVRKSLEYAYALRILCMDNGQERITVWVAKYRAEELRQIMQRSQGSPNLFDTDLVREQIRHAKQQGHTSRVSERELADWAGLSMVHEGLFSQLNERAHFSMSDALMLYSEIRDPDSAIVDRWHTFSRAMAATHIQDAMLIAAFSYSQILPPDSEIGALCAIQMSRLNAAYEKLLPEGEQRGALAAIASGWARSPGNA